MSELVSVFNGLPGYHDEEKDALPFPRSYIGWGPGDDYMRGDGEGWDSAITFETWEEARGFFDNDPDLNVVADFYFNLTHDSVRCETCDGTGYNPETHQLAVDFYDFPGMGRRWCDNITQDEVEALVARGRLWDFTRTFVPGEGWRDKDPPYMPTADEVNAAQHGPGLVGHDGLNRYILIEARAKRLGVYGQCEVCKGDGEIRTGPDRLEMYVWVLHPRKGASRGLTIRSVAPASLAEIREKIRANYEYGRQRFAWALAEEGL